MVAYYCSFQLDPFFPPLNASSLHLQIQSLSLILQWGEFFKRRTSPRTLDQIKCKGRALSSSECSSSARQQKWNVQVWLELDTSLQIMFNLELVIKYKSLSLTWLGMAWFISQVKLKLYIKLNIMFLSQKSNTSILSNLYQVYYLAYINL